ncbi:oxidoreductase [Nocardia miyunensis]|uniref:oxidoreductase n=1 Tax=Nocardia miyunensis TaxID=282684 RepID=UPI00082A57BE|nr:oxidoreductase [Nocardia miyunensis]
MTTFHGVDLPDLSGTTAVVTGANSGIGRSVSRALTAAGARVVLAVRSIERGRSAGIAGDTQIRELDLGSLESIRTFAADWDGPIDLLINNAGVSAPTLARTTEGFEAKFGVNHLGHFALTNLLLPHITGRIVTVASQAERFAQLDFQDLNWERRPYQPTRAYNDSKFANLLFTAELQRRLTAAGSSVRANAAHPGLVATNIYHHEGPRRPMDLVWRAVIALLAQDADHGARPVLYAAVADIPGNSFAGPRHLAHMRGAPELIDRSEPAQDQDLARRLWAASEHLTGIGFPLPAAPAQR